MMFLLSVVVGLGAAAILITAGYLFGVSKGAQAREQLRTQQIAAQEENARLREAVAGRRARQDEGLRSTIEKVLVPLVQREQVSIEMARLDAGEDRRADLESLLDRIAETGGFAAVLLSDAQGWPIAASRHAKDEERLGATGSLLMQLAERMTRDGGAPPLSVLVHDGANRATLSRLFGLDEHQLVLTAVAAGGQLTSTSLDPALTAVDAMLTRRGTGG